MNKSRFFKCFEHEWQGKDFWIITVQIEEGLCGEGLCDLEKGQTILLSGIEKERSHNAQCLILVLTSKTSCRWLSHHHRVTTNLMKKSYYMILNLIKTKFKNHGTILKELKKYKVNQLTFPK